MHKSFEVKEYLLKAKCPPRLHLGLYTISSMPIVCGIYYNNGGSEGNIILRNRVGDDRGGDGVRKQRVGAQRIVLIRAYTPRKK